MDEKEYLGVGMKFPPQINRATGRFVTSSEDERIRQSVYLILSTQVSERPMRPDFGSNMMGLTFFDINQSNVSMVVRSVRDQIVSQEPRIDDVKVDVRHGANRGTIIFNVNYRIRATMTTDSIVYPFYLNIEPEEEEEETQYYEPEIIEEIEN